MILILIKHKANSAHGGQQENLITADRILCAMVLVTNYLSRITISIDLCIYSFSLVLDLSNAKTDATVPISVFVFEVLTSAP